MSDLETTISDHEDPHFEDADVMHVCLCTCPACMGENGLCSCPECDCHTLNNG